MKQSLKILKAKLKNAGFRFEASTSVYNPMERFADYVSTFLINFLSELDGLDVSAPSSPDADNPLCKVTVNTEQFAPTSDLNGRIDILVTFDYIGKRYAIIIENKLNDAPYQPRQLARYNE